MVNGRLRGPRMLFAWQVQHLESLGAACGQRPPRDRAPFRVAGSTRCTGCCFCVAGAALREPGRCLWSTASAGPRTFLRGRCSTRCTGCCFCVAGAALREPGRCLWSTASAGPRTFLRGRCSTRCTGCCFCVAGAALREPGRCLWSTVSAGPRTFCALRGRCSTRCTGCCFCVAGAALREPGRRLWSTALRRDPAHLFAWQVQHSVHRMLLLRGRCSTWRAWALPVVNGLRRDRAPFCVAGAALGAPDAAIAILSAHFLRLSASMPAAKIQRSPPGLRTFLRGRCSTRCTGCCFCVAGAALREPGRCKATAIRRDRAYPFCVAGAESQSHVAQLMSHNFTCDTSLPQLISQLTERAANCFS